MTMTWADVMARYEPGMVLPPLVGSSTIVVDHVDEDQMCVKQRLWRACLTREEFENAARVLDDAGDVTPVRFGEMLRVHHATTFHVTTDCSRVPNLSAILLRDLGAFPGSSRTR